MSRDESRPALAAGAAADPVLASAPPAADPGCYYIETWGCQMNLYDSERLASQLRSLGYRRTWSEDEADVILLNTCSVREKAEEKLFSRLGRLRTQKRANPRLLIGVAGCVAQQERERILKRSPLVDFVLGTKALGAMPGLIERARAGQRLVDVEMRDGHYDEIPVAPAGGGKTSITVVEGCNKNCSFCIVPLTRGPEVNRAPETILAEAQQALDHGSVEIELLGQNVNAYQHGPVGFAELIRRVGALRGLERLRFQTSHPRELTDPMIAAMAETPAVCNHLHLPVQSGSSSVLKRMWRGYDRARYLDRIARLRRSIPDIALSTDIIVGFPGETDAEFEDTLSLLAEVEFDQVYAFVYSPRPFTRAAELPDAVPPRVGQERLQELFRRQEAISRRLNARFVGLDLEVLVDGPAKVKGDSMLSGRSRDYRPVNFPGPTSWVGRLVPVHITAALAHSLLGESGRPA